MGGSVNVAIRFRDGRAICTERWTNNITYWFIDPRMYDGDEAYVQDYLDMTRNTDFILDPHGPGRPSRVRNSGYGLIVFDYLTGHLLDNNTYSTLNELDAEIYMRQFGERSGSDWVDNPENSVLKRLSDAGRVRYHHEYWTTGIRNNQQYIVEDSDVLDYPAALKVAEDAFANFRNSNPNNSSVDIFRIDTQPLTYIRYDNSTKDSAKYKEKLAELQFPMTEAEGLNASLPPIPKPRKLSEKEKIAREVFRDYKGTPEGKVFDRVDFDKLEKADRKRFMDIAVKLASNPDLMRTYRIEQLFSGFR